MRPSEPAEREGALDKGECEPMSNDHVGKPTPGRLMKLIEGNLGAPSKATLVAPGPGLDAAVIDIGGGRVMVIAEDPIFPAVGLPLDMMGEFTVHIGASDVAVTGVKPTAMTYTLLLPPGCSESDTRLIIESISNTAKALGITIVGGHTGWYGAVNIPIVGGVTVWGFAEPGGWVSPGGAREGDVLLMTKGPAIEAAALLAVLYRKRLAKRIEPKMLQALCARTSEITVVADALTAFEAGATGAKGEPRESGVHAMHDATEGGVLGGLWEMAESSGLKVHADLDSAPVPDDIAVLAAALGFDPWRAISEGTLLAAVASESAQAILRAWQKAGIQGYILGYFDSRSKTSTVKSSGMTETLTEPGTDPFWPLFFAGMPGGAK
jgi:hydrogenase expression/formation protein HypE